MTYNINKLLEKAESYTSQKVAENKRPNYIRTEYQIKYKGIEFSAIVSDNKIDDLFVLNIDISPRSNCLRLSPTDDLEVAYQEIISKIERIKKLTIKWHYQEIRKANKDYHEQLDKYNKLLKELKQ